MEILRTLGTGSLALAVAAGGALANTYIVDDDGGAGVDFTDIPPALILAVPGDVILVRPGNYSSFVLTEGLTIVGSPGANVAAGVQVLGIPAGEKATLADLLVQDMVVENCAGLVLLHSIAWSSSGTPLSEYLRIQACTDVRVHGCTILGTGGRRAVTVSGSRLELVQSDLRGGAGADTSCGDAGPGADCVVTGGAASRVHLSLTSSEGGDGGYSSATCISFCGGLSGDGGSGVRMSGGDLLVSGRTSDRIEGGFTCGTAITCDGTSGDGLTIHGGGARVSGATFAAGVGCGPTGSPIANLGGTLDAVSPRDPSLELTGNPVAGGAVTFTIHGPAGSNVRLFMGRHADLTSDPGIYLERLATRERALALGAMPASGMISRVQPLPGFFQGFTFWAQGEIVLSDGTVRRTNSVAVIFR